MQLTEFETILYVKSFIRHIKMVKAYDLECTDPDGVTYTVPVHKNVYTDLKQGEYEKIKANAEVIKAKKKLNKLKQKKIEIELQSELLSENKRTELINEYNNLSLAYTSFDSVGFVVPNNIEEIAEALDLLLYAINSQYSIEILAKKYFEFNLGMKNKFNIHDINEVVYCMFKLNMKKGWSFDSIWIVYNAILLHLYEDIWKYYYDICTEYNRCTKDEDMEPVIKYLDSIKEPHGLTWNLFSMLAHMLEGIDIDTVIKYYPVTKNINPYKCTKDYYSSMRNIKNIKEKHGNILNEISSKTLLMEVLFAEPVLFDIACKMFSVIGYQTGVNTSELLIQFLSEAHEKANKPKLEVIKGNNNDK